MLKTERAIVTDIEGTTRDTIEEFIQIDGIPVKIIDTAGIRKTNDNVEKIGIKKSMEASENADLIIAIIDGSRKLEEDDEKILEIIKDKKAILLINKQDKKQVIKKEEVESIIGNKPIISISALNKIGIDKIYKEIAKMYSLNEINIDDSLTITNERHKQAIGNIHTYIEKAKQSINEKMPIDIITINITDILEEIGKITGESVTDDVISGIFKKFCLGK